MGATDRFAPGHLWAALAQMAADCGTTVPKLAEEAGLTLESLTIEGRLSPAGGETAWPSIPTIFALVEAAGLKLTDFGNLVDGVQRQWRLQQDRELATR